MFYLSLALKFRSSRSRHLQYTCCLVHGSVQELVIGHSWRVLKPSNQANHFFKINTLFSYYHSFSYATCYLDLRMDNNIFSTSKAPCINVKKIKTIPCFKERWSFLIHVKELVGISRVDDSAVGQGNHHHDRKPVHLQVVGCYSGKFGIFLGTLYLLETKVELF